MVYIGETGYRFENRLNEHARGEGDRITNSLYARCFLETGHKFTNLRKFRYSREWFNNCPLYEELELLMDDRKIQTLLWTQRQNLLQINVLQYWKGWLKGGMRLGGWEGHCDSSVVVPEVALVQLLRYIRLTINVKNYIILDVRYTNSIDNAFNLQLPRLMRLYELWVTSWQTFHRQIESSLRCAVFKRLYRSLRTQKRNNNALDKCKHVDLSMRATSIDILQVFN